MFASAYMSPRNALKAELPPHIVHIVLGMCVSGSSKKKQLSFRDVTAAAARVSPGHASLGGRRFSKKEACPLNVF